MTARPWFRMHSEAVDDEKLRLLAFEDRWHFVAILCLKAQGTLDSDAPRLEQRIALKLGLQLPQLDELKRRLMDIRLIDETFQPVSWGKRQYESDTSTERVRAHRERVAREKQATEKKGGTDTKRIRNVSVTSSEQSRAEQNRAEQNRADTEAAARPTRTASRGTGIETDDWFLNFKLEFPNRAGSQPWPRARKAANARIAEGHTPDEFIAAAVRYAAFCEATGKTGTEFAMQAATFLGPDKPFTRPWDAPETPQSRAVVQRQALEQRQLDALRTRAEAIGFRAPLDGEDLIGYRTLVERAESQRPRAGGIQPLAKLLGSQTS